eukprot:6275084-Prymnesium_polylepis.2
MTCDSPAERRDDCCCAGAGSRSARINGGAPWRNFVSPRIRCWAPHSVVACACRRLRQCGRGWGGDHSDPAQALSAPGPGGGYGTCRADPCD